MLTLYSKVHFQLTLIPLHPSIPFVGPKMWKLCLKIVKTLEKAKGCRVLVILSLSLKEVLFYGDKYSKDILEYLDKMNRVLESKNFQINWKYQVILRSPIFVAIHVFRILNTDFAFTIKHYKQIPVLQCLGKCREETGHYCHLYKIKICIFKFCYEINFLSVDLIHTEYYLCMMFW